MHVLPTGERTAPVSGVNLKADVDAAISAYTPHRMSAAQWAMCSGSVREAVAALKPSTVLAARTYLMALSAYLVGPAGWDKATPVDLKALLAAGPIQVAAEDPSFGSAHTRRSRCDSLRALGRVLGAIDPTRRRDEQLVLPAIDEPVVEFATPEPSREGEAAGRQAAKVVDAVQLYTPRKLTDEQWRLAAPTVRRHALTLPVTTAAAARVELSNLTAFLADEHVWDGQWEPDLARLLTQTRVGEHIHRMTGGTRYTKSSRRSSLLRWARAVGSVDRARPLRIGATPVDPVLAYAAVRAIPVNVAAAAYAEARPDLVWPVNLDYVVRAAADLVAIARRDASSTVWTASALRTLAEATHQGGAPMTSHRADNPTQPSNSTPTGKPLSRKARLAEAQQAYQRALKNAADAEFLESASTSVSTLNATPLELPDPSSVDADIRRAVESYLPNTDKRAAWQTNRVLAAQLVMAYAPSSPRNARNVAAHLAGYLNWLSTRGGRNAAVPLVPHQVVTPHLFEEYLGASHWSDGSLATTRSVLRRIDARTRPHAAPVKLAHPKVAPPYTTAECNQYARLAWHQPSPRVQRRLGFIVALGLGAGLDATDLRVVRRGDLRQVHIDGLVLWVVTVHAEGARGRVVPVRTAYYPLLERAINAHRLQGLGENDRLVENPADKVSIISNVVTHTRRASSDQRVSLRVSRLRHRWLVDQMCAPVALVDLMRAAGLRSGRSLSELVEHCGPADPTAVAAVLAAAQAHAPVSTDGGDKP